MLNRIYRFVLFQYQYCFHYLKGYIDKIKYYPRIIPPYSLRRAGKKLESYIDGGEIQKQWLINFTKLNSKSNLLDIGCGDGRLASALASYLTTGSYSTFDVQQKFISYLQKNYEKKYPYFTFKYANLFHSYYNPKGKFLTEKYRFPYNDNSFDVVFLNSIFTHFLPDEIGHFLKEIYRVLKVKGIILATYFLGNKEAKKLDRNGKTSPDLLLDNKYLFNYKGKNCWVRDNDVKEKIVIIEENWLKTEINKYFSIEKIIYGTWPGRKKTIENTQQDIICAKSKKYRTQN